MKSVNIAELKNRLSFYLNDVRAGREIVVRDRNTPIARLVPMPLQATEDEELRALASAGTIRLGAGVGVGEEFWAMPAPRVSAAAIRRTLDAERDEG